MKASVPVTILQDTPSMTWTINHSLGCNPMVSVKIHDNGDLVEILPADITYPSISQVLITFSEAQSGEVRLA